MYGTPVRKDKRLHVCLGVMAAVMGLRLKGIVFTFDELLFFLTLTSVYVGQSQWGLVKRQKPPEAAK